VDPSGSTQAGLQGQPDLAGPPVVPRRLGVDTTPLNETALHELAGAYAAAAQTQAMDTTPSPPAVPDKYKSQTGTADDNLLYSDLAKLSQYGAKPEELNQLLDGMEASGRITRRGNAVVYNDVGPTGGSQLDKVLEGSGYDAMNANDTGYAVETVEGQGQHDPLPSDPEFYANITEDRKRYGHRGTHRPRDVSEVP
jgi:hypothetical protein